MSRVINGYIKRGQEPISKWDKLNLGDYESIHNSPMPESLVPFYGSDYFNELTAQEKKDLYKTFLTFSAEMFIYLEYQLSNDFKNSFDSEMISEKTAKALEHLVEEEACHTKAFYDFLKHEKMEKSLHVMNSPFLLLLTTLLIKLSPVCVLISAAKHESYSLVYSRILRDAFGGWKENTWTYINYLHLLDEVHHVPFQLEVYDEAVKNMGPIKMLRAITATFGFFILMQIIAFLSACHLIKISMPKRSLLEKAKWTFRLIQWVLLKYKPAYESRANVRKLLDKNPIPFGEVYKVLYR